MVKPRLQFDFTLDEDSRKKSIVFTNPIDVIQTNQLSEVKKALQKVKKAIDEGYYVAGYLSYEASYALYNYNRTIESEWPLLWFGLFKAPHLEEPIDTDTKDYCVGPWTMEESKTTYMQRVKELLQRLHAGPLEQVNYTVPFQTNFHGHCKSYYNRLKKAQQSNFNAFLQLDKIDILSISPEKHFSIQNDTVTVRPMKGTAPRGKSFEEDQALRQWLQHSEKNKIENDLIVDLMKEELTSIAHDITPFDLYRIETYPTVFQMTSGVRGRLDDTLHPVDVLTTLFPCSSITGTPKEEAIQTIAEMETKERGIYCGSIGYFTPEREAIFNVAIRTLVIERHQQKAYYYAGGAITKQSDPIEEYDEVLAKTNILHKKTASFQLLETMLIEEGTIFLKKEHMKRIEQSAHYFNYPFHQATLQKKLTTLTNTYTKGYWRLRLLLDRKGSFSTEIVPLEALTKHTVILANEPIDHKNPYLYHKTTERSMFTPHQQRLEEDYLDVLLWNTRGELTEFTIGNVVVEIEGRLLTPLATCGLLRGTFRERLLADGVIEEAIITIDDLKDASSLWLINSVRKWVEVSLVH